MDNIEITVFDEINDYKEKIYFFNFRQWAFSILIAIIVIPTYLILKEKIGEEITSYIVIAIAAFLGFIGFVKIHELPAEKILPYWFRHYTLFAKPIKYIPDAEYELLHQKKHRKEVKKTKSVSKSELKELKKFKKQEILLKKAEKKFGTTKKKIKNKEILKETKKDNTDELTKKLSQLSKEQQDALLKLLGK
ncbi:MAG TPA: PrgI family protein [Clostridiaceae bacterium]|jgi:hypothetical protein|nr:PrgI family protein [Clostridia bacterium]HJJ09844.1 PrgI family protein [Clostridiaceae bacterium]